MIVRNAPTHLANSYRSEAESSRNPLMITNNNRFLSRNRRRFMGIQRLSWIVHSNAERCDFSLLNIYDGHNSFLHVIGLHRDDLFVKFIHCEGCPWNVQD